MEKGQPKILIIRLSSIGDVLLTTSFIRQVRTTYPNAQIDFVVKKAYIDLVRYNPHLNNIFTIEQDMGTKALMQFSKLFKKNRYQYVFDLHNNIRSRLLTSHLNTKSINRIQKNKLKRALLVYFKINRYNEILTIPQRYANVGKEAGIAHDGLGLELYWKNKHEKEIKARLKKQNIKPGFFVVAPGAGYYTKRWPLEYFEQLCRHLLRENETGDIIVVGNKDDRKRWSKLPTNDRIHNWAGGLGLLETAAIINKSDLIVSNDSGVMHMAQATQKPLIAIFGSTVRELGFFPESLHATVVENEYLRCRPCSHVGRRQCPLVHFKCMKDISPERVFNKIISMSEIIHYDDTDN